MLARLSPGSAVFGEASNNDTHFLELSVACLLERERYMSTSLKECFEFHLTGNKLTFDSPSLPYREAAGKPATFCMAYITKEEANQVVEQALLALVQERLDGSNA